MESYKLLLTRKHQYLIIHFMTLSAQTWTHTHTHTHTQRNSISIVSHAEDFQYGRTEHTNVHSPMDKLGGRVALGGKVDN